MTVWESRYDCHRKGGFLMAISCKVNARRGA